MDFNAYLVELASRDYITAIYKVEDVTSLLNCVTPTGAKYQQKRVYVLKQNLAKGYSSEDSILVDIYSDGSTQFVTENKNKGDMGDDTTIDPDNHIPDFESYLNGLSSPNVLDFEVIKYRLDRNAIIYKVIIPDNGNLIEQEWVVYKDDIGNPTHKVKVKV